MEAIKNKSSQKNLFKKVKSKYILKIIFNIVDEVRLLDLIRYNQHLQKILNKTLTDYKKESVKIIIDIIPKLNEFGKFINRVDYN